MFGLSTDERIAALQKEGYVVMDAAEYEVLRQNAEMKPQLEEIARANAKDRDYYERKLSETWAVVKESTEKCAEAEARCMEAESRYAMMCEAHSTHTRVGRIVLNPNVLTSDLRRFEPSIKVEADTDGKLVIYAARPLTEGEMNAVHAHLASLLTLDKT